MNEKFNTVVTVSNETKHFLAGANIIKINNVFVLTEGMTPADFSCGPICWNLWRFNWLHNKIK